jgi:hypothetical protein
MPTEIPSLITTLLSEKSVAITALLFLNIGLSLALWKSWVWHRKDREEDRERWIEATGKHTTQLVALTEAITQLRIMVSQCNLRRGR